MAYRIVFEPRALKEFEALDGQMRRRVLKALQKLATNPFSSANVKALHGGGFRLRVGDWRVLYSVQDDILLILVLKIAHRREAYR
ncbi:MAG: type II toxin-antitoxin system RelE/ParE family toxin [Alphaproteobacteria bacterium]|nr:type II toxin-antitoxin system RelE/ParE family toxin [Alphaproteobacteria bacterium]